MTDCIDISWHPRGRIDVEKTQGKMHAIESAFATTRTELVMFLDDDTVASPDLIAQTLRIASQHTMLGTWSPRVELEFEDAGAQPPARLRGMLSERLIDVPSWSNDPNHIASTPWGGGMCVRRVVADAYLAQTARQPAIGSSSIRWAISQATAVTPTWPTRDARSASAWACFPHLVITHLIPSRRSTLDYLLRNLEAHEYSHVLQNYYRSGAPPPAPTLRQRDRPATALAGEVMRSSARSWRPRIAVARRRGKRSRRAATGVR